MEKYNNFKRIREIYGATQDDIAKVAGVNRSTVSLWETGSIRASSSKLEKLSMYYGIGPECFYDLPEIDDARRDILMANAKKEKEITEASNNTRNKADEFSKMLESVTFKQARYHFMYSMKMLLALADDGDLQDLKVASEITQKMLRRLAAIIAIREEEERNKEEHNQETLQDLLNSFMEDEDN